MILLALLFTGTVAGQESGGSLPDLLGDFFDGGSRLVTITTPFNVGFHANGVLIPGTSPTLVALERDFVGFPDDLFAEPLVGGDGKTFVITGEPLPPSEIPTSPGPDFTFAGGTAVFTNSTDEMTPSPDPLPPPGQDGTYFVDYSYEQTTPIVIPAGGGGVGVRRIKLAENNNPIPTDRVFFTYHFFNDVPNMFGDVNRYTMGFEKTYADGNVSFELRVPFAATLDALQAVEATGNRNFEFGNAVIIWKAMLARTNRWAFTMGTGVSLPLASSTELLMGDTNILKVVNESVHFLPFIATAWTPTSRVFAEAFVQFDIDPYGNTVLADVPNLLDPPIGRRH